MREKSSARTKAEVFLFLYTLFCSKASFESISLTSGIHGKHIFVILRRAFASFSNGTLRNVELFTDNKIEHSKLVLGIFAREASIESVFRSSIEIKVRYVILPKLPVFSMQERRFLKDKNVLGFATNLHD